MGLRGKDTGWSSQEGVVGIHRGKVWSLEAEAGRVLGASWGDKWHLPCPPLLFMGAPFLSGYSLLSLWAFGKCFIISWISSLMGFCM